MKNFNDADRSVWQALHRMNSPEMRPLTQFLSELLEDYKDSLILSDSDRVTRVQGRAAVLKELLEAVHKAPEVVEKLRK